MNSWIWMLVILTVFNYRAWNRNCQLNFPGVFDWGQHAWFTFLRKWFWIREVYLTLSSSDALCINRSISEQLLSGFCWWWHKDWGKGGSQKKKIQILAGKICVLFDRHEREKPCQTNTCICPPEKLVEGKTGIPGVLRIELRFFIHFQRRPVLLVQVSDTASLRNGVSQCWLCSSIAIMALASGNWRCWFS